MIKLSGPTLNTTNLELVPLATAKVYLQQPSTDNDTILQMLLDHTHRHLYAYMGNRMLKYVATSWVYLLDGDGYETLQFPQYPILPSTMSIFWGYVTDKDNTWQTTYTYLDSDWNADADEGIIYNLHGGWPIGRNNLKVSCEAGYSTVPPDIVEAVCQWVGVKFNRYARKRWDVQALTRESESQIFREDEIPLAVRRILRSYERVGMGFA